MTYRYSETWSTPYVPKPGIAPAAPILDGDLEWEGCRFEVDFLVDSGADYTILPFQCREDVERQIGRTMNPITHLRSISFSGVEARVPIFEVEQLSTEIVDFGSCLVGVALARPTHIPPSAKPRILLGRDLLRRKRLILVLDSDKQCLVKAERL